MRFIPKFIRNKLGDQFKDKDLSELVKGSSKAFLLRIAGMLLGYMIMIYITNTYGAASYGEYALGITVLSIAVLLPRFGLDTAMVRIIGELKLTAGSEAVKGVVRKAFSVSMAIGLVIALIFFFFSSQIALKIFDKPTLINELETVTWIIIPFALIYLIGSYFQAYKKVMTYMLFNMTLLNMVFFVVLIVSGLAGRKPEPFYLYAISVGVTFLIGITLLLRAIGKNNETVAEGIAERFSLSKILKVSSPMLLSSSFVLLINWLDIIMLGILSDERGVGIYNASQRLAAISGIMLLAINAIATPKFVEFFTRKDYKGLERVAQNSTKLIFMTTAPILLIFILFPKSILSINGSEFMAGYIALIFLCIGKFVNSISGSVGYILQMTNNQTIFQNVLLLAAVVNGVLNYLLIPEYGFEGAAFASMITISMWNIILVVIIRRKLGFWTIYVPFLTKSKPG